MQTDKQIEEKKTAEQRATGTKLNWLLFTLGAAQWGCYEFTDAEKSSYFSPEQQKDYHRMLSRFRLFAERDKALCNAVCPLRATVETVEKTKCFIM